MFEENVVSSAGTTFRTDAAAIERRIHGAGFKAVRRNVRYEWLTDPA
jgi:cyclic dehypoxanthinyl futalosine synthase